MVKEKEEFMEVIKISPRGYCYGVVDALQVVRQAAKNTSLPRPIHVIGQIIHNRHAIEELTRMGVITLDGPDRVSILEQVKEGTVIFTAHGVSLPSNSERRSVACIASTPPVPM
jgi:4-hydroxy-3-methylbut-2-enyl diphosphate reductase